MILRKYGELSRKNPDFGNWAIPVSSGGGRASLRRCVLCPKEEFCWWTADVYPFCFGARPETDLTIDLAAVITSNEDLISLLDLLDAISG